jgi:hypothetical protein
MAVYQPNTNWDDVNARGGVTGTTTAPTLSSSDPNAETANTDWSQVLDRGGVTGTTTPPTTTSANNDAGIAAAYQKYLGRGVTAPEYDYWRNNGSYEQGIAASPEAQAYATRTAGPAGSLAWVQQQLAKFKSTDDPSYWVGVMAKDPKVAAGDQSAIDYWLYRMSIGDGAEAVRTGQLKPFQDGGGGTSANGNAFSDPATSQWESLVRQLTDRLNNPMPDSAKELQQTQALDPLERQRQTMKDQTAQRLSQRGITPTSGTWDEAMREVDRQFNELRTRTQAGFANSWAQNEDNRMLQAANLFKQIPQYQDARLTLAQNTLIPTNVGSLLQMQQQGNQWDAQQQQTFWTALAKSISDLLNR